MRAFHLVLLFTLGLPAVAATPEQDYRAARDSAVAQVEKQEGKDSGALDKKLRLKLSAMLRPLVDGPPPGFSGPGAVNIETLERYGDAVPLDGLHYRKSGAANGDVVVSAPALLRAWLDNDADAKGRSFPAALGSEDVLTQALSTDAHLYLIAPLPIHAPPGADFAAAWLGNFGQDFNDNPPEQMIVILTTPRRIFIADLDMRPKLTAIPACAALLRAGRAKADAAAADRSLRLRDQAEAGWIRCWRQQAKRISAFPALTAQAQTLVDGFASP